MKYPLSQIKIGERQRAYDESHAQSLADSMTANGQIHNIGLRSDGLLIWGRHRYEAAKLLQWTEIEATVRDDLTPEMEQELEYEEDVRRKDRSWQEKCCATFKLKRLKEKRTGETWSLRKMADFTGIGKSSLGYYQQIAEALNRTPKDEEIWSCENYMGALKLLIARTEAEVLGEINRRRQLQTAEVVPAASPDDAPTLPGVVQQLDTTPEKVTVYIHGRPIAFKDAKPDEHFFPGRAMAIVGFDVPKGTLDIIGAALNDDGFAVLFNTNGNFFPSEFLTSTVLCQDWPLVWNQLNPIESTWPFSKNYTTGFVLTKRKPYKTSCISSVITAAYDNSGTLPPAVVEHVVAAIVSGTCPVFCIGGVDPVHVAAMGHTPIWFEADPLRYEANIAALRQHYEETIPGVEVIVR